MPKKCLVTLFFGHRRKRKHRSFLFNLTWLKIIPSIFLNVLYLWVMDLSPIWLGKAGQPPLYGQNEIKVKNFRRRQRKHREISFGVWASQSFWQDFLKYFKPLQTDSSPISFGKAWQRPLELKKLSWLGDFLEDFVDYRRRK